MAILKFRVYFEEDDTIYRDVAIRHTQTFFELHEAILKAYEFDNKHKATFYRSNDQWKKGKEITLDLYEMDYKVPPLMMKDTMVGSEIRDPGQKFLYLYDFNKNWSFMLELISVTKEEDPKLVYPATIRAEGIAPSQYGTKGLLGEKFTDVEEKYDLTKTIDGFAEKDEEGEDLSVEEDGAEEEEEF